MLHQVRPVFLAISLALASTAQAAKPAKPAARQEIPVALTEVELAHNLGKMGEERLQEVVDRFNKLSKTGSIKLVRQGKNDKPGVLNLIRRNDMDEVLAQAGRFLPLHQMMKTAKEDFNSKDISPDLKAGSVDDKGRYVSLPVAYSTPVLFYNKNALRKAKLDPEQPPKTWFEMQGMLDKIQDAGYACPYTTSWPTWVHIDNVSALSGVPAATEKGVLAFNGLPQVKHIAMMTTWYKAGYFRTFGRGAEANQKFMDGECAMITTDSWEHTEFREAKGVELGVALLPYHDDVYGGRQHTLADGGSLWVGAGYSAVNYKTAAKFINFLMTPEMQIELVRVYGQLPLTGMARTAVSSKVLRDRDDSLKVAYASLKGNGAKPAVRVANIDQVRIIVDEELEAVWADKKPPKAALDTAVARGNALLAAKPALKKSQPF
jgi:sn-glycerol 3-phosphate transport system substrate-binding protein